MWVLILYVVVSGSHGSAGAAFTTIQGFDTEGQCKAAGAQATGPFFQYNQPRFSCVETQRK